jgi:hypothetical protein
MNSLPELDNEILPTNPIRVETALSRYPVHRLAKHGDIAIDIRMADEQGELSIRWEVNYPKKPGQPGPLGYKIDTLIINRRIEEAPRPIPRFIRLGSLREIIQELGFANHATEKVKKALRQNAGAFISAKIRYRTKDGTERYLEIDDTRYGIVFTGQKLPDGRKADAVYLVLHDFYMEILNHTITRPLDYDYLKSLPPASQRFYELLSYQMYATLKNDRARAKLRYSEFCTYAPLVRQTDWNVVRPQLARIHAPHKKSGYVAKVDFQDTVDNDGNPDWIMLYQPGHKARAEHRAFAARGGHLILDAEPFGLQITSRPAEQKIDHQPPTSPLVAELVTRGVTASIAADLVQQHPAERIAAKIEVFDWMAEKQDKRAAKNPGGYLCDSIRKDYATPKGFVSRAEREEQAEAKRQADQKAADARRREREDEGRQRAQRKEEDDRWKSLSPAEQSRLDAEALAAADPAARDTYESMKRMGAGDGYLSMIRREHIRRLINAEQQAEPA